MFEFDNLRDYKENFLQSTNPYISFPFIQLNAHKAEKLLCFANKKVRPDIGIVFGLKNNQLFSPFSAPFGGFHYRHEYVYVEEVDRFLCDLKDYFEKEAYAKLSITLPPDIYAANMNAKFINSFIRNAYNLSSFEITNQIYLNAFQGNYQHRSAREYYQQAQRKGLMFKKVETAEELEVCYDIVSDNRKRMGRPIYMNLDDLINMRKIWEVDFFLVFDHKNEPVASGIFYRAHQASVQAVFWGDTEAGRPLRAMDFLILELCKFYKDAQFSWIDLGISTEAGKPNNGLLRFKETHESTSSVRYTFSLIK